MKDKVLMKKLYRIATLQKQLDNLYEDVEEKFEDCLYFKPYKILRGCTVEDDILYDAAGKQISNNIAATSYFAFVNQQTGYSEDSYSGDLFCIVDSKGTVVVVYFEM